MQKIKNKAHYYFWQAKAYYYWRKYNYRLKQGKDDALTDLFYEIYADYEEVAELYRGIEIANSLQK